ncbi:uncharacterized protein LOC132037680 isoform X2 [Lycium ferocissimum]|uniref:uncharacterized protein LOC132037680 isoform X2 n=1 Tax=Lycium ferocissimum TaxID=112874 RepID=UPI002815A2E6|nr:uncharacterized protein LOC132037680 isoform X2 [Lycium ferocissimum]
MEKRLRSSLKSSAQQFLNSTSNLPFKQIKPSLKTLIHQTLNPNSSSDLTSTLPLALHNSITQSIRKYKTLTNPNPNSQNDVVLSLSPQTPPTKRLRRSGRNKKNNDENESEDAKELVVEGLRIYVYISFLCVTHPKRVFRDVDLLPGVRELHDNLILFECDCVLLSEIANLCEEWWKEGYYGKETLISQALPFLLSRALTLKKKVDVHRVYVLREAFALLDFEDESIEDLKHLIMRCVISPLFLKTEDGRKFVAFTFGLSVQVLKEALAMLKSQIPFGRKSILEAFGEIVFRAWKVAEGVAKDEIENGFLQGMIDSCIHAGSSVLAVSTRRVLGGFINQRTTEGVEKLIFRLAEPVIFRSLQVANSNVRQNSLHLLLDLFPLEDPDATKEAKDTLLDKQFFLLDKLLVDECPDVRVVAVEGCCRILHLFWEIIPSPTITKTLTKIFEHMIHDSCPEVRLSTVNAVIYLLGNPHSHDILKVLLPRMGHLINDISPPVRAAVVDLLLALTDLRKFQFHKVVHIDLLLSTLANDQPMIGQKITKLLLPSYFPSKVNLKEACNRCVTLMKRSPLAGARFCEFAVSEGTSLQSWMELLKILISLIVSPGKLEAEQIDGSIIAVSHLCIYLVHDESYQTKLKEELSGEKLKHLFAVATSACAQASVCNIISSVCPDAVDDLFDECMTLVTNCGGLSNSLEKQDEVRSVHKMMVSCHWLDEMFENLARLLQRTASQCHKRFGTELVKFSVPSAKRGNTKSSIKLSSKSKQAKEKKMSNKVKCSFKEEYEITVGVAWQIKDLLLSESTRNAILQSGSLETIFLSLKAISEVSILQCTQCEYMSVSPILAYTALALHRSFKDNSLGGDKNVNKRKRRMESANGTLEETALEMTIHHLLGCTNKLFRAPFSEISDLTGSDFNEQQRILNKVKMLTAVLKFIADAHTMDLVHKSQEECLSFTLQNIKFVISSLRRSSDEELQFTEDMLKEIYLCLKSSFTYAAKLMNVVLKSFSEGSQPLWGAFDIANELLNLYVSIEECLGYGYAVRLFPAVKPWVPDLILALGSVNLMKQSSSFSPKDLPLWVSTLARTELAEQQDTSSDEEPDRISKTGDFKTFKKLVNLMVQLLRANYNVLDAVGPTLLNNLLVGLKRKNFGLVFGLLHFVCVKLVKHDEREWKDLTSMLTSLQQIYPQLELEEESCNGENARQELQSARALIEPVWRSYLCDDARNSFEEE